MPRQYQRKFPKIVELDSNDIPKVGEDFIAEPVVFDVWGTSSRPKTASVERPSSRISVRSVVSEKPKESPRFTSGSTKRPMSAKERNKVYPLIPNTL